MNKSTTPPQGKNAVLIVYEDGTLSAAVGLTAGGVLQIAELLKREVLDQPFAKVAPPSVPEPASEPT